MRNEFPLSLASGGLSVPEASISSHISNLVDPGIRRSMAASHSVRILVIGFDLPNLTKEDYAGWRQLLSVWKGRGVNVEYIALDSGDKIMATVESNRSLLDSIDRGDGDGVIEIFYLKDKANLEPGAHRVVEALRKLHRKSHFLLAIDETDEKRSQMWLEGCHEPGATKATDCVFFDESDNVVENPAFLQNRSNFGFLKSCAVRAFP